MDKFGNLFLRSLFTKRVHKPSFGGIGRNIFLRGLAIGASKDRLTSGRQSSIVYWENTEKCLTVSFANHEDHRFNYRWLRDNCKCPSCFNKTTQQKTYPTHKITADIKPQKVHLDGGDVHIKWNDGHESHFHGSWLLQNHYNQPFEAFLIHDIKRHFWGREIVDNLPEKVDFDAVLEDDNEKLKMAETIAKFGFVIVKNTPTYLEAVRQIANVFGAPRHNHYGDVWLTTNSATDEDMDHADLAYSNVALPGHTDGTYFIDPPGLQMFHCHVHTGMGGETILVDGINAALKLKEKDPESFHFLAETQIPFRYYEKGHISRNLTSVIKQEPYSNEIYRMCLNFNDTYTLHCLSYEQVEQYYHSYSKLLNIIYNEESELCFKLTPGNLLIVNNWRVLHARKAFTGTRSLSGCYVSMDDYMSRTRVLREKLRNTAKS